MNDLPNALVDVCHTVLYADDTTLLVSDKDTQSMKSKAEISLETGEVWFTENNLSLNANKTAITTFTSSRTETSLHGSYYVPSKYLGFYLDSLLTWKPQIDYICSRLKTIDTEAAMMAYFALLHSIMTYALRQIS